MTRRLLLALTLAGCSDPAGNPEVAVGACGPLALPVPLEIGTAAPDGTDFVPFAQTGLLPITAGFQGLVFVSFALRSSEQLPPRMEASMRLVNDDGSVRIPTTKSALFFEPQTDGGSVDPSLLLLLDPPLVADWNGVTGTLEVQVYGGSRCATVTRQVQLTDRGGCFMEESGAIVCHDDAP